ncbi:Radical SAM superfamily enzyme YgiQ, UPF0313 family [Desulfocicer vacuolatum DSM 3385]|uniref:Radical SAM superfamily enzyme YgiQ, UPF0313 family n=1 Tax=Desulfocicer vacuolatum DSM 3385 TaxID=1121400 RepID=A0A1W2AZS7_9BACT|nr:radical SAM protein [Desulfocicer vacuolatum]SMC66104.1 Radical SAM superfamily enzyme YgiQ, UPF0313 family [Desulfocicer vacuolatum DSM 3385]
MINTVVLEHPRMPSTKRFNDIANTPLWSCLMGGYAAAALDRAGFHTRFMDGAQGGWSFRETEEKILCSAPALLCINAVYFWEHTILFFDFLEDLKKKGFNGHINLFGFFPTLVYGEILEKWSAVDSVAVGEFEHTLVELANRLDKGEAFHGIEGLASRKNGGLIKTPVRSPEKNPDHFAFPWRSSLEGTVTVLASRGCYNHCSFCPVPSFYNQGPLWRGRTPENIALEMSQLVARGVKNFYFADPNFIGPGRRGKKRVLDLLTLIEPLNIRFGMETRPADLDDEILEKLTAAGFNSLLMGIESGSERVLGNLNKQSAARAGAGAIALCRRHGIEPEIGFLMFVPDSSVADLRANMAFLMENNLLDRLERTANLMCHCQIVLAGTSGYAAFEQLNRLEKSGLFGFEGEVTFLDPGVEWMARRVVFACHTVLRSMSDKKSPIYWDMPDMTVSQKVNDYLVDLFFRLLDRVETRGPEENLFDMEKEISQDISGLLKSV